MSEKYDEAGVKWRLKRSFSSTRLFPVVEKSIYHFALKFFSSFFYHAKTGKNIREKKSRTVNFVNRAASYHNIIVKNLLLGLESAWEGLLEKNSFDKKTGISLALGPKNQSMKILQWEYLSDTLNIFSLQASYTTVKKCYCRWLHLAFSRLNWLRNFNQQ